MSGKRAKAVRRDRARVLAQQAESLPDLSLEPHQKRIVIVEGKFNDLVEEVNITNAEEEVEAARVLFAAQYGNEEIINVTRMVHQSEPELAD